MQPNTLTITIKPEHRKDCDFWDTGDCPLSRAIRSEFPDSSVHISCSHLRIGGKFYAIDTKVWNEKICNSAVGDVKVVLNKIVPWALFQ